MKTPIAQPGGDAEPQVTLPGIEISQQLDGLIAVVTLNVKRTLPGIRRQGRSEHLERRRLRVHERLFT